MDGMNGDQLQSGTTAAVVAAVRTLISAQAHTATVYLSPQLTVRATRTLQQGKIPTGRLSRLDIALTIGRPNYRAQRFIKQAKAAGEPFPIRHPQLTFPPKRR